MKTIAVLTGGGDCPGLNAVIRGVVRSAVGTHGWRVIGIEDGFDGLLSGIKTRELDLKAVRGILQLGGTILGTSNHGNPLHYPVMEDGEVHWMDVSSQVVEHFNSIGADALIAVGGDGTLKIAQRLYELGMNVVGIPKTIDNDLKATDVTFGYNTAVGVVTEALDRLHTTAESHHRVMVVEVMGRDAGWIALESGISGGADVILLPEIPFSIEKVCAAIRRRRERGGRFSIVVVAEGASALDGEQVVQESANNRRGGVDRLGGIGEQVAGQITQCLDMEVRTVVLGHLQRGGTPSPFDRILGTRFGVKAVDLIADGDFGKMVALRGRSVVSTTLAEAVGSLNLVPAHGEMVQAAEKLGIMLGR
ncbi:6-phosphofructokinase [Desulfuromonas acetoxidans]|uniref:ATP-dependent 6-phosphofructokinase n=1 Tax=Desulfuromonas acetoxidans (strain DSM 684 / 11070) TaxID=281689 RepID=Q1K0N0_DESA6|nr:6-phosphofructokinase [Desulfuromonas acetoxidans]EAT15911.1 Phosphofructokinase, pyrophosphate dependent [Desulfuromonas acetoxidans DSM 684]MBF0644191.1 6-phosphofructokinase [Desulfuromonas acetoxidans]NVD24511.1 6-phosphofructokinase [Desulfuromonas acetoxidans]NVE16539.1 6-phosphofructokinase [Desulfuromonas acetoxidans]